MMPPCQQGTRGYRVSNDFDWFGDETRESRIIPEQPETAVYLNPNGAAVIRQQGDHGEDPFVII